MVKKKVKMSVDFQKFNKTNFDSIQDAMVFVRQNKLSNVRLKLVLECGSIEEWDNF